MCTTNKRCNFHAFIRVKTNTKDYNDLHIFDIFYAFKATNADSLM